MNIPHKFNSCHVTDVDECRENVSSCDPSSETCINEIGSYRCEPIRSSIRNESRTPNLRSAHTRWNNEENKVDVCPVGYSYSYSRKTCLGNVYLCTERNIMIVTDGCIISGTIFGYEYEFLQCYATIPYCQSSFAWVNNFFKTSDVGEIHSNVSGLCSLYQMMLAIYNAVKYSRFFKGKKYKNF